MLASARRERKAQLYVRRTNRYPADSVRRSTILFFCLVVLAGCGGTDMEQISSTIDKYAEAAAEGEPKRLCRLTVGKDDDVCESRATALILDLSDEERKQLAAVKVTDISIIGRVAEAELDTDVLPKTVRLRKEGRKWLLDFAGRPGS